MSERREQVFGGVPAWLLAEYLVELGGTRGAGSTINGAAWRATIVAHPRPPGTLSIGRVTVTIEGPQAEQMMEALRGKALRGGG